MMLKKNGGFTLIELMVVIVIIGVLASLAIPRFTEASAKAKIAEAPRVIASFESAYLAHIAEVGTAPKAVGDLIFTVPGDSKWFKYGVTPAANPTGIEAAALSNMGKFLGNEEGTANKLTSTYVPAGGTAEAPTGDCFTHDSNNKTVAEKMIPNFFPDIPCT